MTNRMALFDDAPADAVAPIVTRQRVRTKRAPRVSIQQTTLKLPPRRGLLDRERDYVTDGQHWRLAGSYVQRQGWRFEKVIDRDDQVMICMEEICRVFPDWDANRGKLSTYLSQCFYHRLSREAAKAAKTQYMEFSRMGCGGASIPAPAEDIDELIDAAMEATR
jgi:hypothetical protein